MLKNVGQKPKRVTHMHNASSSNPQFNGENFDFIHEIIQSMDSTMSNFNERKNVETIMKNLRTNHISSSSNELKTNIHGTVRVKKFLEPNKHFPLMAKCQKNLKYLRHNQCIPKQRAHVSKFLKSPLKKYMFSKSPIKEYLFSKKSYVPRYSENSTHYVNQNISRLKHSIELHTKNSNSYNFQSSSKSFNLSKNLKAKPRVKKASENSDISNQKKDVMKHKSVIESQNKNQQIPKQNGSTNNLSESSSDESNCEFENFLKEHKVVNSDDEHKRSLSTSDTDDEEIEPVLKKKKMKKIKERTKKDKNPKIIVAKQNKKVKRIQSDVSDEGSDSFGSDDSTSENKEVKYNKTRTKRSIKKLKNNVSVQREMEYQSDLSDGDSDDFDKKINKIFEKEQREVEKLRNSTKKSFEKHENNVPIQREEEMDNQSDLSDRISDGFDSDESTNIFSKESSEQLSLIDNTHFEKSSKEQSALFQKSENNCAASVTPCCVLLKRNLILDTFSKCVNGKNGSKREIANKREQCLEINGFEAKSPVNDSGILNPTGNSSANKREQCLEINGFEDKPPVNDSGILNPTGNSSISSVSNSSHAEVIEISDDEICDNFKNPSEISNKEICNLKLSDSGPTDESHIGSINFTNKTNDDPNALEMDVLSKDIANPISMNVFPVNSQKEDSDILVIEVKCNNVTSKEKLLYKQPDSEALINTLALPCDVGNSEITTGKFIQNEHKKSEELASVKEMHSTMEDIIVLESDDAVLINDPKRQMESRVTHDVLIPPANSTTVDNLILPNHTRSEQEKLLSTKISENNIICIDLVENEMLGEIKDCTNILQNDPMGKQNASSLHDIALLESSNNIELDKGVSHGKQACPKPSLNVTSHEQTKVTSPDQLILMDSSRNAGKNIKIVGNDNPDLSIEPNNISVFESQMEARVTHKVLTPPANTAVGNLKLPNHTCSKKDKLLSTKINENNNIVCIDLAENNEILGENNDCTNILQGEPIGKQNASNLHNIVPFESSNNIEFDKDFSHVKQACPPPSLHEQTEVTHTDQLVLIDSSRNATKNIKVVGNNNPELFNEPTSQDKFSSRSTFEKCMPEAPLPPFNTDNVNNVKADCVAFQASENIADLSDSDECIILDVRDPKKNILCIDLEDDEQCETKKCEMQALQIAQATNSTTVTNSSDHCEENRIKCDSLLQVEKLTDSLSIHSAEIVNTISSQDKFYERNESACTSVPKELTDMRQREMCESGEVSQSILQSELYKVLSQQSPVSNVNCTDSTPCNQLNTIKPESLNLSSKTIILPSQHDNVQSHLRKSVDSSLFETVEENNSCVNVSDDRNINKVGVDSIYALETFKNKSFYDRAEDDLDLIVESNVNDLVRSSRNSIMPLLDLYKKESSYYQELKEAERNVDAGLKSMIQFQMKKLQHLSFAIQNIAKQDPCFLQLWSNFEGSGSELQKKTDCSQNFSFIPNKKELYTASVEPKNLLNFPANCSKVSLSESREKQTFSQIKNLASNSVSTDCLKQAPSIPEQLPNYNLLANSTDCLKQASSIPEQMPNYNLLTNSKKESSLEQVQYNKPCKREIIDAADCPKSYQPPPVFELLDKKKCSVCFRPAIGACSQCYQVYYCSQECLESPHGMEHFESCTQTVKPILS